MVSAGIEHVQIIGGEPLLTPGATLALIQELRARAIKSIEIFTNGLYLTPELLATFHRVGVSLALSTYGSTRESYIRIAGNAALYEAHLQLFPRLEAAGLDYRVCLVRMNRNEQDTIEGVAAAFGIPASRIRQDIVRMTGRAGAGLLSEGLVQEQWIGAETFRRPIRRATILRNANGHSCFSRKIFIAANLATYPCAMERRLSYGSLTTTPLSKVLAESAAFRAQGKDGVDGCKHCEYRYACFDCRPNCGAESLTAKPWYCGYNPITGHWTAPDHTLLEA
jgi:radical SAM protein with 4Fe4S-binding SPASM domain